MKYTSFTKKKYFLGTLLMLFSIGLFAQLSTQLKPDKLEFLEGASVKSYLAYNSIGDLILRNQNTTLSQEGNLYLTANDDIFLSGNAGADGISMGIFQNGNISIGEPSTSQPPSRLQIKQAGGTATSNSGLRILTNIGGHTGRLWMNGENFTIQKGDNNNQLVLGTDGNVGIGGPSTVNTQLRVYGRVRINGNTDGTAWTFGATGSSIFRGYLAVRDDGLEINQENVTVANRDNGLRFVDELAAGEWRIMHSGEYLSFILDNVRQAYIEPDGDYIKTSDRRLKNKIKPLKNTLSKVMRLNPVTYYYKSARDKKEDIGFIAQEVAKLFPQTVSEGEDGTLGLAYDHFGVLAIQAIQEQHKMVIATQTENELLQNELAALKKENLTIQEELTYLKSAVQGILKKQQPIEEETNTTNATLKMAARLNQNQPNPFNGNTTITYHLPEKVQNAHLRISTIDGKIIQDILLDKRGEGQVNLQKGTLIAGHYFYSLIADGQVVETLKMMIAK